MSSELLIINLSQLCVTCGETFKHDRLPITNYLISDEPAVRFIDAIKTHTKFAELNEAQCPEYVCDACFCRANMLVQFLRQCDRSAQFIKECIVRQQKLQQTNDEDVKHDDNHSSLLIDRLIADTTIKESASTDDNSIVHIDQEIEVESDNDSDLDYKPLSNNVKKRKFRTKLVADLMFVCHICGESFKCRKDRRNHSVSHSEGRYKCRDCDKRFRQQEQLRTHSLTHAGERPFACAICLKRFFSKQNLQQHRVVHEAGKPFQCNRCGKLFKRQITLSKHLITACKGVKEAIPGSS